MPALVSPIVTAWRRLWRSPGFALLSILTLAVAIGANTAIWSLVDGVLLSPLPFPGADRLVALAHAAPRLQDDPLDISPALYLYYRRASHTLADIAAYRENLVTLTGGEAPERLRVAQTTAALARVLGVVPARGRAFTAEDERPGAPPVVLLGDGLWRRRFAADPGIVGRTVRLDGVPRVVVGILPAGIAFPVPETEAWLPLAIDPATASLGVFSVVGVGRLAAGASVAACRRELDHLLVDLPHTFPGVPQAPVLAQAGLAARVHPLRDDVVGDVGPTLWILFGAVGFILLIACANVANLLLVRGEVRRRETAIRLSLGAPPGRLTATVLAESLLLGVAAGAVGLGLAGLGLHLLVRFQPIYLPRLSEVGLNGRVLSFTAAVALLTSVVFGLVPALRSSRAADLPGELKGGGRAMTQGRAGRRARQLLVGLEIALASVLLTGSGLMLLSFLRLARVAPGFSAARALKLELSLPRAEYPDDAAAARFWSRLVDRLAALPGVEAAGASASLPFSGWESSGGFTLEDFPLPPNAPPPVLAFDFVSQGYFQAMGIPLREGRDLERADALQRTGVVVVSEKLARRYRALGGALGKRLYSSNGNGLEDPWYTIVGVVGDVRHHELTQAPGERVYYPLLPKSAGDWTLRGMNLVLRTRGAPEALGPAVRRAIREVDPNLAVVGLEPLTRIVERARARLAFTAWMFAVASGVALLLGGVGLYAFVAYTVGQRTPEIGIRMALGARPADVRRMVLREALALAAGGIAAGLAGALALTRSLRAVLFEVSPLDPLPLVAVPLLLAGLALLASHLPARRAARVDPLLSLKRAE